MQELQQHVQPSAALKSMVDFQDWGLIDYERALNRQSNLVQLVAKNEVPETVIICQHPPVVTKGRASKDSDFQGWQGKTVDVQRGGRLTYHGPSQVVIYPILKLDNHPKVFAPKDLHAYLDWLQQVTVNILAEMKVEGRIRKEKLLDAQGDELLATGVWAGNQKIASVGIAVSQWVSYHGIAINIQNDPNAHQGIKPCGFSIDTMTSVEAVTGKKYSFDEAGSIAWKVLSRELNQK